MNHAQPFSSGFSAPVDMSTHGQGRLVTALVEQVVDDCRVLLEVLVMRMELIAHGVTHRDHQVAVLSDLFGQAVASRAVADQLMELLIQRQRIFGPLPAAGLVSEQGDRLAPDVLHGCQIYTLGSHAGRFDLEDSANVVDFAELCRPELTDNCSVVRPQPDDPDRRELSKRFPHGGSTDPELERQFLLNQPIAAVHFAAENRAEHFADQLSAERAPRHLLAALC